MTQLKKRQPPGRTKIMKALSSLMRKKDFQSITTAVIAAEAGVTEGLIYKYFKDKKDLLYQVLKFHFEAFQERIERKLEQTDSTMEKLDIIIRTSLSSYVSNRVFARILLLEVRSSPEYFKCSAYDMVRLYAGTILDIIRKGIENGEIKQGTNPHVLRQVILGAIEHACLGEVIFDRPIDAEAVSTDICTIIFKGVQA